MSSNTKLAFELRSVIGQLGKIIALKHNHSKLRGAEKHILFLICELKNCQPITISEIANKIGVTLAAATYFVMWSPAAVAAIPGMQFPNAGRTTMQFRVVTTASLTAGDVYNFVLFS